MKGRAKKTFRRKQQNFVKLCSRKDQIKSLQKKSGKGDACGNKEKLIYHNIKVFIRTVVINIMHTMTEYWSWSQKQAGSQKWLH